jgi:hypothetical protein
MVPLHPTKTLQITGSDSVPGRSLEKPMPTGRAATARVLGNTPAVHPAVRRRDRP